MYLPTPYPRLVQQEQREEASPCGRCRPGRGGCRGSRARMRGSGEGGRPSPLPIIRRAPCGRLSIASGTRCGATGSKRTLTVPSERFSVMLLGALFQTPPWSWRVFEQIPVELQDDVRRQFDRVAVHVDGVEDVPVSSDLAFRAVQRLRVLEDKSLDPLGSRHHPLDTVARLCTLDYRSLAQRVQHLGRSGCGRDPRAPCALRAVARSA